MEAGEAAEYAIQSSLRTDSRSLREARVSSGIAASAYLKFGFWRGEASQHNRSEEGSRSQLGLGPQPVKTLVPPGLGSETRSQPTEAKVRG